MTMIEVDYEIADFPNAITLLGLEY